MEQEKEIVAWVGLDWADQQHEICLQKVGEESVQCLTLKHQPEALHQWVQELRRRFGQGRVAVALEQFRGGLIHALMGYEFLVLYRVPPKMMAKYREAFRSSGAKDDPSDAAFLLELVRVHSERLRAWTPEDVLTRTLQRLVQYRRHTVHAGTALRNELSSCLKGYFPQALRWAGSLKSAQALDFLARWPSLPALQKARAHQIRQFYQRHGSRAVLEERLQEIRQAQPLTEDPAVVMTSLMRVQGLIEQLRCVMKALEQWDEKIAQLFKQHRDHELYENLPGAGPALAPRLLAAFGSDRSRYQSAQELQQFSGIAPVTECSGKSHWVHWRLACPKFLRQSFHEFATHSIARSLWARAYYQLQRERGKGHHAAVRALAYKWIRILFRCWQERQPYQEEIYLRALERRQSLLWVRMSEQVAAVA